MEEKQIFTELVNILKLYTKNPELLEKATKETHILNDLKVNSARLVDVVIKCEDVFGISIDDDDADKIRTIGDAIEVIKLKLDEYYTVPEKLKQFVNYTTIQTGVHIAVTGVMWAGLGLMAISGTVGLIRRRRKKK